MPFIASPALVIAAACSCTAAQDHFYAALIGSQMAFSQRAAGMDATPRALGLKLGAQLDENFAAEARIGSGVADASLDGSTAAATLRVDPFVGLHLRGTLAFSDSLSGYGLAGVARTGTTLRSAAGDTASHATDFSYGAGVGFALSPQWSLDFEWLRLLDKKDARLDALSLDVALKF